MKGSYRQIYAEAKAQLALRVNQHRLLHSISVSDTAQKLAEIYSVDPHKALLAGILHDWDRGLSDEQLLSRAKELALTLEPGIEKAAVLLHGPTGAVSVRQAFPGLSADIYQAIARHTTVAPDMSPLDMIIYCADALEPLRVRDNLIPIRALVGQVSLEALFMRVFQMNWDYERSLDSFVLSSELEAYHTYIETEHLDRDLETA
jgi:predicted HD superfamily hydrolase involved in NAD metabolism